MGKSLFSLFIVLMIFAAACAPKAPAPDDVMEKKPDVVEKAPVIPATGEAAVDAVGNDLDTIDSVEKDLGTEELNEIDSGLQDIENI